jgi:putative transposase
LHHPLIYRYLADDFNPYLLSACGWHGDADENASYNLSIIGGVVSLPRGSETLSCELNRDDSGLLKHSTDSEVRKLRRFSAE